jgi:hypothetical protein
MGNKGQTFPYSPELKKFGMEAQAPLPPNSSPCLNAKGIKPVQQIVGRILYYARAVEMKVLMVNKQTQWKKQLTMHQIIGLPLWPLERKGPNPRIRHGIKHTFRCVVSPRSKSL